MISSVTSGDYDHNNAFTDGYMEFDNSGGNTSLMIDMDGSAGPYSPVLLVTLTNATLTEADTGWFVI